MGFTNEDWYAVTSPPLTSYSHPYVEMGMMAAQILLRRLAPEADDHEGPRIIRFSGHINMRQVDRPSPS